MIEVKKLIKNFTNGEVETKVLKGVDLTVPSGQFLSIMGKSGAGKSTLLYQMSLLDLPTAGEIIIDKLDTSLMNEKQRTNFRLKRLGYVFQDYALLPELSAAENVFLPLLMQGMNKIDATKQAIKALDSVGLAHRHDNRPSQMSGGEQQRVSIARAIAQKPDILFADEPTANLDSVSGITVMDTMRELHEKKEQTIVMVTHELDYAKVADRVIYLEDGLVNKETLKGNKHE